MRTTPRLTTSQLDLRATLMERRERVAFVILCNLIPLIGILFLGWSAQNWSGSSAADCVIDPLMLESRPFAWLVKT